MDLVNDLHMGGSTSTEDLNLPQKRKMQKMNNGVECEGPDFSLDNSSPKMDATINHPLHESPALPNFLSCQIIVEFNSTEKNEKSKRKKTTHNPIEGNDSGTSENTFSPKASTPALDMLLGHPIQCFSSDPITSQSCEKVGFCQGDHEEKEQKMINTTAAKASTPALDMLSGHPIQSFSTDPITSQSCEEVVFCDGDHEEKEQKMINTTAAKASTSALDMLSGHPIQCFSTDPIITSQSCEEVGFCQGDLEELEQEMIDTTTEKQHDVPEVSCNHISVAASPEPFVQEYVPEVVKLNIEHGINDNISNPEEKNSFVNDTSLMKKDDDDPADYDLSDKNMCYKACARRQMVNVNSRRSNGYPSPESPNKEPTIQDHDKDDSHQFSDGSLRIGLMGGGTKLSIDQVTSHGGAAAEEIKLSSDIINEQSFMTTSSVVDIPVEHLEADSRQLDHTEITRSYLCCADEQMELNTDNINEQRSMTTSSPVDIHVEQLETNGRQLDHSEITRNDLRRAGYVSDLSIDTERAGHLKISQFSLDRSVNPKKKLLILDVNGLLADFVSINVTDTRYRREPEPDFVLKGRKVYKRPFCDDFLQFCFDRFHVGVWSSRAKSNVDGAIKFLMGKSASKLLFCWNQSHCTTTEFTTVENVYKPLVLKELRKLWEKEEPDLPWKKGEFNESNTLLLDDSPYKALMNPLHSAIFPYSYRYYNTRDSELGPGGDLRNYLEGLAVAENVKRYVAENPFGQRPIREANPSWSYYSRVIESVRRRENARPWSTRYWR